jgi:NitT/TauT family transport system substrate-binding protein
MLFERPLYGRTGVIIAGRYLLFALAWLAIISILHYHFEHQYEKRQVLNLGYMPVITNLAAPLLDAASRKTGPYRFRAIKFSSFAEMADALCSGHLDGAFIIAPLAIVLKQHGEDVRIVYIGNRHESTLVTRKELGIKSFKDLAGRSLGVPMRYSGHYLEIQRLQEDKKLHPPIKVVEMNPPDMASALASGGLDAYFVGEPFAAQTITSGNADLFCRVEKLHPHFICNLLLVREQLITDDITAVQHLVSAAVRSGFWAQTHPADAARIASHYWNQPEKLIYYALTTPKNRIEYNHFIPQSDEIEDIAKSMVRFKLADNAKIDGIVDDRFARQTNLDDITDLKSIIDY